MKLQLAKSKVAVLKRKEDFMILTADVSNMTPQVKAAHDMFCADILRELRLGRRHTRLHVWRTTARPRKSTPTIPRIVAMTHRARTAASTHRVRTAAATTPTSTSTPRDFDFSSVPDFGPF